MIELFVTSFGRLRGAGALALIGPLVIICSPSIAQTLSCVEVMSSGSTNCTDAGGVASTCATATCPAELTLTGGGGACAAGGTKIKSLFPRVDDGSFTIACEKEGVDPQANAICCRLQ
jgi:hypothetical protein